MKIRAAREKALMDKSYSMKATELMSAFFYIANAADIRRMADVLEVEEKAKRLAKSQ